QHDPMVYTMIGYSKRKMGDMDGGFSAYRQALAIDPDNLNTHEYMGEAYVTIGRVEEAKLELATLKKLCGGAGCEQYDDLAKALAGEPDED
ncbi:MAG: tetratricopeptide repeat protein, partial [Rhizobiales bacterium]|nr:tetratricopeptide repeat protein [Hyphomicrobiales bacterium]